jgi:hypothetical protein
MKTLPCLFLLFSFCTAAFAEDIIPYLQTPTPTSIYVCWETMQDTSTAVSYVPAGGSTSIKQGEWQKLGENVIWHWVKLEGLTPNTEYNYQIKTETIETPSYSFQTLSEPGYADGHVRFVLRSDCQSFWETGVKVFDAAVAKMKELYGDDLSKEIDLIFTTGDIVGTGPNLHEYKPQYFQPLYPLSPHVPAMVSIGNHERESQNYYNYMKYEDLAGPEGEAYYKFQIGRVLFIALNSNPSWRNDRQIEWLSETLDNARDDDTLDWVFAFCHHPGRSSIWSPGNTYYIQHRVIPLLSQNEKAELLAYGHSHDYERGAHPEATLRTMCVGGAAGSLDRWTDNVWIDYPEIQRSFDHHHFVIVDVDVANRSYTIQTWSLGTPDKWLNSVKIDSFTRKKNSVTPPIMPTLTTVPDSIDLPFSLQASAYVGDDPMQTSQFQLTATQGDYSQPLVDSFRDYEHYFFDTGAPEWETIDQHVGIDLTKYELTLEDAVWPGQYFARARYRDQNLLWSDWSQELPIIIRDTGYVPVSAYNKSIEFDGRNSYVEVADNLANATLPQRTMSIEAWVKLNSHTTWGGYIGALEDNGTYEKGWVLGNHGKQFSFALASKGADDGNGFMTYLDAPSEFNYDQWNHIVGTYNGATMKLYINGRAVATSGVQSGDILYDSNSFFDIGVYHDDNEFFVMDGQLDDVRLWDVALNEAAIQSWMFKEINETHPLYENLVSYWDFNSFAGNVLPDEKGDNSGKIISVGVQDHLASTAPVGLDGQSVKTKKEVAVGPVGSDISITINSTPNASNFAGIYLGGSKTGAPVENEVFPDGVIYRANIFWGVKEFGDVNANVILHYATIKHTDVSENLRILKRDDANTAWSDITSDVVHDQLNKTIMFESITEFGEYTIGWENLLTQANASTDTPETFALFQNYPNPFNPTTHIRFSLAAQTTVELKVYDLTGRIIRTLIGASNMTAGVHEISWDGLADDATRAASGVYFCQIASPEFTETIKMMLIH